MDLPKPVGWALAVLVIAGVYLFVASGVLMIFLGRSPDEAMPWTALLYLRDFHDIESMRTPLMASFGLPALGGFLIAVLILKKDPEIFGTAKWAGPGDIIKAKLNAKDGILLGRSKTGRFLMSDEPYHTLLVAPTRAGKGVGVIIPNLLNWKGSALVLDVKYENYEKTSGFRGAHGQKVFLWSPMATDLYSHRFNPLDMVSEHPFHRITDVQKIATLLVDVSEKDPMWGNEARALFIALTLYVLDNREGERRTLGEVYRMLTSGSVKKLAAMILETHGDELEPNVHRGLTSFAEKADKEASGVVSQLQSSLRLFDNPIVDAATCATDFNLRDLRRKRMTIYVGVQPDQLHTAAPLLRLFFQLVINVMSEDLPGADEPHKVLMLLDEFPSLGNMSAIVTAFTLLAGYGVRVMPVVQGLSWLDKEYGKDTREGLVANCGHQVFFGVNDPTTATYVSEKLGSQTLKNRTKSTSTKGGGSRNLSTTGRPLLDKDEVQRMPDTDAIVFVQGQRPIKAKKIRYFADRVFKERSKYAEADVPLLKTPSWAARSAERKEEAAAENPEAKPEASAADTAEPAEKPATPRPAAKPRSAKPKRMSAARAEVASAHAAYDEKAAEIVAMFKTAGVKQSMAGRMAKVREKMEAGGWETL